MFEKEVEALKRDDLTAKEVEEIVTNVFYNNRVNINSQDCQDIVSGLKNHIDKLAQIYNCNEEDIYFGDINNEYPYYQVVFGDMNIDNFKNQTYFDGCLIKYLIGDLNISSSNLESIGFIKAVINNVNIRNSFLNDIGALNCVLGNFNVINSSLVMFDSIKRFKPELRVVQDESQGVSIQPVFVRKSNLYVGGDLTINKSHIHTFRGVNKIQGDAYIVDSTVEDMYSLSVENNTFIDRCKIGKFSAGFGDGLSVTNTEIDEWNPYFQIFKKYITWNDNNVDIQEMEKELKSQIPEIIKTFGFEK